MEEQGVTLEIIGNASQNQKKLNEIQKEVENLTNKNNELEANLDNSKAHETENKTVKQDEIDNLQIEILEFKGQIELIEGQLKSKEDQLNNQKDDLKKTEDLEYSKGVVDKEITKLKKEFHE